MFWDSDQRDTVSILAGNLDETDGLAVRGHIFVDEKPDFYAITDGLPQFGTYPPEGTR